jgi:hypothetical protein
MTTEKEKNSIAEQNTTTKGTKIKAMKQSRLHQNKNLVRGTNYN